MLEELLPYYERELASLHELSSEFAQRYPKIAQRLLLEGEQSEDPHVERLVQSFAFLTARIRRKIDDEFPEITEALLHVLYPHYIQPFPSCTILQLETNPHKQEIVAKHTITRHHIAQSPPIGDVACQFRTCYDVDLYPLHLKSAKLQLTQSSEYLRCIAPNAAAAITLEFETQPSLPIAQIGLDRLRFFLDGEPVLMHLLYELLLMRTLQVRVSNGADHPAHVVNLPATALSAVGFGKDEGLLDYSQRSFLGYRLLSEYFAFPEKFLFIDLSGLDAHALRHSGTQLSVQIFLSSFPDTERHHRLEQTLSANNFKMGCTPAANLFQQAAEPITLTHRKTTYPVIPNARHPLGYEVISIDSITNVEKNDSQHAFHDVPSYYSLCHHTKTDEKQAFWYATREPSIREHDKGTDVELSFVDLHFSPARPALEVLSINLTCSNRDLPAQLPFGGSTGNSNSMHTDFSMLKASVIKHARPLRKPTASLRLPNKRSLQWRLISHLSLNHLTLVSQGTDALKEMLSLYNTTQSPLISRQIQGIVSIDSKPCTTLVTGKHFQGFVRGIDITLTLDEQAFVGAGMVLFASIMERFFAFYCGPNHFTRLTLRSNQQEQEIFQWPARTGEALVI